MTVTVGEQVVAVPDSAGGSVFSGSGTYVCEEDAMTIQIASALVPFVMTRIA